MILLMLEYVTKYIIHINCEIQEAFWRLIFKSHLAKKEVLTAIKTFLITILIQTS